MRSTRTRKRSSLISVLLLVAAFMASAVVPVAAQSSSLSVMSFNIRYDNPGDGTNAWKNRVPLIDSILRAIRPDIIGMQEVLHHQLEELQRILPGYATYGVGRDDGLRGGEYVPIFYDRSRFRLDASGFYWLSPTPDRPSRGWDAALPRIATWCLLSEPATGRKFGVVNIHLDHIGEEAREKSALLIQQRARQLFGELPWICLGDFNAGPESGVYRVFDQDPALQDAAKGNAGAHTRTYQDFGRAIRPVRIDFIFAPATWTVTDYRVLEIYRGDLFISDHFPLLAELHP